MQFLSNLQELYTVCLNGDIWRSFEERVSAAYNGDKLGQGRENAKTFLREHPEVALEIENKIKADAGHLSSEMIGGSSIDEE